MARINRSDILKTITRGSGKEFYLFEIVINRFFAEMQKQIDAGNVVAIKGVGTFYLDTKKKRADRPTYGINPNDDRFNPNSTYDKFIVFSNLKTLEKTFSPIAANGQYHFKTINNQSEAGANNEITDGLYAFAGYKTLKFKASLLRNTQTHVIRFKASRKQRLGGIDGTIRVIDARVIN